MVLSNSIQNTYTITGGLFSKLGASPGNGYMTFIYFMFVVIVLAALLGNKIILSDKKQSWNQFFNEDSVFDDDFLAQRDNDEPQQRDFF